MKMTINETLALTKMVRERVNELRSLRNQVSTKERSFFNTTEKVVEPQYDVKLVDRKVSELETWLFRTDAAIKQSNATVQIEVTSDVESLLKPLD
jgi:hypothetical protein